MSLWNGSRLAFWAILFAAIGTPGWAAYFDRKPTLESAKSCKALLSSDQRLRVVGVLAMSEVHGPVLGLGEYFGSRHYSVVEQLQTQFGKLTSLIWVGELELAPATSDVTSSFVILKANETAGMAQEGGASLPLENSVGNLRKVLVQLRPGWIHSQATWATFVKGNGRQHLDERLNQGTSSDSARHLFGKIFYQFSFATENYAEALKKKTRAEKDLVGARKSLETDRAEEKAAGQENDPSRFSLGTERWIATLEGDVARHGAEMEKIETQDLSMLIAAVQILHETADYSGAAELNSIRRIANFLLRARTQGRWSVKLFEKSYMDDWTVTYAYMRGERKQPVQVDLIKLSSQ